MAWSDQCKVAFEMTVITKKNMGEKKKSERQVLREVASETDIPLKTLERWWTEAKSKRLKNEANDETAENDNEKGQKEASASETHLCRMGCGRPVCNGPGMDKPLSKKSPTHGLCETCRRDVVRLFTKNKTATAENGIRVFCPKCGHMHYILDLNKEIKNADLQQERHSESEEEGQLVHGEDA